MGWSPLCLLILLINASVIHAEVKLKLYVEDRQASNCKKYTEQRKKYLEITHARIIRTNDKGKILGIDWCKIEDGETYAGESKCTPAGTVYGGPDATQLWVMVAVRSKSKDGQFFPDVEYSYNEETMKMADIPDPAKQFDKFNSRGKLLHITKIEIEGVGNLGKKQWDASNCFKNLEHRLIYNHGLYFTKIDGSGDEKWHLGYFEPRVLRGYLIGPK